MKCKFLFMDADYISEIVDGKLEDGIGYVRDKSFLLDGPLNPIYLKTFGGVVPLFIVKWDCKKPSVIHKRVLFKPELKIYEKGTVVTPEFENEITKNGKIDPDYITPEILRKLIGLKILGNMIKPARKVEISGFMMLIVGIIVGVLIMFSLRIAKVI